MFVLYRLIVGLLFYCSLPILLLLVILTGKHREGLWERFGFYKQSKIKKKCNKTVWFHASSVGEVQAVRALIFELKKRLPSARYVLTTMTMHGKRVAKSQLDDSVSCFLAPLDVPWIVDVAIKRIKPDIYICIETELWPTLLYALSCRNVWICLANGRMSDKSYNGYLKMRFLLNTTLNLFDRIAVISERDKEKYLNLGADRLHVTVEGNVKYDLAIPKNSGDIVSYYKGLMAIGNEEVFIAGSTHTGEETLLLPLFMRLQREHEILFIIAPRHVERTSDIEKKLLSDKISYHLFSDLKKGVKRNESLILIDTMGELSQVYSVADFVFCGGSLVERGGHNLMEAALWQKAPFFGPSMDDFQDAADILESVKGGGRVNSIAELEEKLQYYREHPEEYRVACLRAGDSARLQQGCSGRQIGYILKKSPDNL